MERCAIELFLQDGRSAVVAVPLAPGQAPPSLTDPTAHLAALKRAEALHRAILKQRPLCVRYSYCRSLLSPARLVERCGWTRLWQRREISNFEYLMRLNEAAGRSYNDLSQYPIFPWVLKDYSSPTIDLSDPSVYRDLSRPMGAQNPDRLEKYLMMYDMFDDDEVPKFHYGAPRHPPHAKQTPLTTCACKKASRVRALESTPVPEWGWA